MQEIHIGLKSKLFILFVYFVTAKTHLDWFKSCNYKILWSLLLQIPGKKYFNKFYNL